MAAISKQEMCAKCLRRDHLCHICDKIYHYSCTEIGYRDISNNEIFYCDACLNSSNALSTNIQVFKEGFRETFSTKSEFETSKDRLKLGGVEYLIPILKIQRFLNFTKVESNIYAQKEKKNK